MIDKGAKTTSEIRSTETLYLRVRPEVRARAIEIANRYGLSVSDYVSALILSEHPAPKLTVEMGALAILGNRVVRALAALPADALEARPALTALRRAIVETMLERRSDYDARLDSPGVEGRWEGSSSPERYWRRRPPGRTAQ
jgi:hypothetical protein